MTERKIFPAAVIASAIGFALWFVTSLVTGKREPWDASAYWSVAYPLALLACGVLGCAYPQRPWRWALVLFASQFLAMCVRNGELASLWPLGLALFAVLALPGVVLATVAARFRRAPDQGAA